MTKTATETEKTAPKVDPVEQAVSKGVEAFIASHLRNSNFSRDTAAWNHFHEGLPVLIEVIVKEVKGV